MARDPAPAALNVALVRGDQAIAARVASASRLIEESFARPALEMSPAYLAWQLTTVRVDGLEPLAVVACRGDVLVGFAAATPRPLRYRAAHGSAYVVSFVCVHPSQQGHGIAARLYDELLPAVAERCPRVLTFAVDGSAGMRALLSAYQRARFAEHPLGTLSAYGAIRGRRLPAAESTGDLAADFLRLDVSRGFGAHLDADPRGCRQVGGHGARVVASTRLTTDSREPFLSLEAWPEPCNATTLAEACAAGFAAFPDHGRVLVVANWPAGAAPIAEAAGLRRMPAPPYRAWLFTADSNDPLAPAAGTSHPVL